MTVITKLLPGRLLRCIAVVFLTVCFAWPTASNAFKTIGVGAANSCGTWLSNRHNNDVADLALKKWVLGFLSGVGFVGSPNLDPLNHLDANAVFHWMDNYCRAHPLDGIFVALKAFVKEH